MYIIKQLLKKRKKREKSNLTPKNESGMNGRSMTEMLGVLVVIGILSISVIVGYNYGMDKYRANTTINEINLRISDLIMQSNRGVEFNLAEWDTKSHFGYTFDNTVRTNVNGTFLKISGLPKRICEMVVDILSEKFDIEVNATRDNEDTALCGTDNEVSVFFELSSLCADVTCGECEECYPDTGTCELAQNKCSSSCRWTGWLDSGKPSFDQTDVDTEKIDNICETGFVSDISCRAAMYPGDPIHELGQVVFCDTTNGLICRNSDQAPGGAMPMPYCLNYEINVYCCDNSNATKCSCSECQKCNDDGSCSTVSDGTSCPMGICMSGVCEPVCRDEDCGENEYCASQNNNCKSARSSVCKPLDFETVTITLSNNTTETWYMSKTYMSWWDASSACKRLGKTMITMDELINNWDGKDGQKTMSDRATKLKEAVLKGNIWTSNLYDSCNAFHMSINKYYTRGNGVVNTTPRNHSSCLALCH